MGGIDLHDRLIAHYRSYIRTKKWPVRAFNHFVDLIIVNCWLMYRRHCKATEVDKKDQLSLLHYRLRLAHVLVHSESLRRNSIPDASSQEEEEEEAERDGPPLKKRRVVVPLPVNEVRYDNVGHIPKFITSDKCSSKCRFPNCLSKSKVKCVKCNIYLCVNNNCYYSWHRNTYKPKNTSCNVIQQLIITFFNK